MMIKGMNFVIEPEKAPKYLKIFIKFFKKKKKNKE